MNRSNERWCRVVASLFLVALVGAALLSILSPEARAFDGNGTALPVATAEAPPHAGTPPGLDPSDGMPMLGFPSDAAAPRGVNASDGVPAAEAAPDALDAVGGNASDRPSARIVPVAPAPPPPPVRGGLPSDGPAGPAPPAPPALPATPWPETDDLLRPSQGGGKGPEPDGVGDLPSCPVPDPGGDASYAQDRAPPSSGARHWGGTYRDPETKGQAWVRPGAAQPAAVVDAPQTPVEDAHLRAAGALLFLSWIALRFVPLALGSRLERDAVREHPVRRSMLDHLKAHPGETTAALAEASGVGCGRATYHLSILVREQLVRVRRIDGRRRFFPYGAPRVADEEVVVRDLARPARQTGRIVQILCRAPGTTLSELARRLGMSPGQAHYHVAKLDEGGLLYRVRRGRRVRHYLTADGHSLSAKVQVYPVGRGDEEGPVAA